MHHGSPTSSSHSEAQDVHEDDGNLADRPEEFRLDLSRQSKLPRPTHSKSTEQPRALQTGGHHMDGQSHGHAMGPAQAAHLGPERSNTPDTPGAGSLPPFDWDDLEARFEQALAKANQHEDEVMREFESLIKVSHAHALPYRRNL